MLLDFSAHAVTQKHHPSGKIVSNVTALINAADLANRGGLQGPNAPRRYSQAGRAAGLELEDDGR
jgi:hypothetical protein